MLKFLRRLFLGPEPAEDVTEEQPVQVTSQVFKKPRPKSAKPDIKPGGQNPGRKKKKLDK